MWLPICDEGTMQKQRLMETVPRCRYRTLGLEIPREASKWIPKSRSDCMSEVKE